MKKTDKYIILFIMVCLAPVLAQETKAEAGDVTPEQQEVTYEKKIDPKDYLKYLKSENYREKVTAIKIIGASQDKKYMKLIEPFLYDKDILVVEAAVNAFGFSKDESAVLKLKPLLRSQNNEMRHVVLEALFSIGGKKTEDIMIDLLDDSDYSVRVKALNSLIEMKSKNAWSRLTRSLCCDPSTSVKRSAAKALAKILNPNTSKELREALVSDDSTVRFYSALALAKMKDKSGMSILLGLIFNEDPELRAAALDGLSNLDSKDMLEPLRKMAHAEKDPAILKTVDGIIKKLEEKYKK